jgi:hypothetical protein
MNRNAYPIVKRGRPVATAASQEPSARVCHDHPLGCEWSKRQRDAQLAREFDALKDAAAARARAPFLCEVCGKDPAGQFVHIRDDPRNICRSCYEAERNAARTT